MSVRRFLVEREADIVRGVHGAEKQALMNRCALEDDETAAHLKALRDDLGESGSSKKPSDPPVWIIRERYTTSPYVILRVYDTESMVCWQRLCSCVRTKREKLGGLFCCVSVISYEGY